MKKYNIRFKLWADGEATISAENEEQAINKLLGRDVIDLASIMNIFESDADIIEVEEVD